mmetsp:Transcript_7394/g.18564  ORF Transcript_7394/g.18564 Transcript_7394/m.18564 type:complete len:97 (-) Transcript_7394:764-1054(-)
MAAMLAILLCTEDNHPTSLALEVDYLLFSRKPPLLPPMPPPLLPLHGVGRPTVILGGVRQGRLPTKTTLLASIAKALFDEPPQDAEKMQALRSNGC